MKKNEVIALFFGTLCAYMALIGIWGCCDESHKGWVDVGFWHPFIILGMGAFDVLVVALAWPLVAGQNELKRLEKRCEELRAELFAEWDRFKVDYTEREMDQK